MTRAEELTLRLLDGELTDAEAAELERLLADDGEARRVHLLLLEQEAALRGTRRLPDLAGATLARLRRELSGRIEKGVLDKLQEGRIAPRPVEPELPWLGSRRFWLAAAAAAAILLTAVLLYSARVASRRARPAEAVVCGQWELAPGAKAAYRVLVRDGSNGQALAGAGVHLALVSKSGRTAGRGAGRTGPDGAVQITFDLADDLAEGDYSLRVEADSEAGDAELSRQVAVRRNFRVMVSTDKPLYQPGQTIHVRALSLAAADLRPAAGRDAVIEVLDGKGNKVFKKPGRTSAFGLFAADFELADQVNAGDYTVSATVGEAASERSVAVRRYALPKFRVDLSAAEGCYQPGQTVKGEVAARYTFGEPVAGGKVKITASEFIEKFRPFAAVEGLLDAEGRFSFSLPLKDHFAGTDLRKGDASAWLEASITDAAGHVQEKTLSLTVSAEPIRIELIPESGTLIQNVENALYIVTAYPDGRPARTALTVGANRKAVATSEFGVARVGITPLKPEMQLTVSAVDGQGRRARVTRTLRVGSSEETFLLRTDKAIYKAGETAQLAVVSSRPTDRVFVDVVHDGRTALMSALDVRRGRGALALDLPPDLAGTLQVRAYRILDDGNIAGDTKVIQVKSADELKIAAELDKATYRPAEKALLKFAVTGPKGDPVQAALSLAGVDEAVFALAEARPGLERVYFAIQEDLLKPRYELCAHVPVSPGELLEREAPPTPQLEEATVALFSAAGGAGAPQRELSERFAQRQARYEEAKIKNQQALLSAAAQLPAWGLFALTLVFLSYSIYRFFKRGPVVGAKADDLKALGHNLRVVVAGLFGGVFLVPIGAAAAGLVASKINRESAPTWATLVGLIFAAGFLAFLVRAVRAARSCQPSRAVPILRKLLAVAPLAFGLAVLAQGFLFWGAKWEVLGTTEAGTAGLAVIAAVTILGGALNTGCRVALEKVSAIRWWVLAVSPLLTLVVTLAGGGFVLVALHAPMVPMMERLSTSGDMPPPMKAPARPSMPTGAEPTASPAPEGLDVSFGGGDRPLKAPPRIRKEFPETLLWLPELITDEKGRAKLELPLADSITTWRLAMSAVSARGQLGAGSAGLRVFQDFFVDVDFPATLTQHDTVSVPLAVYNYLDQPQTVRLEVQPGAWFALSSSPTQTLNLAARQVTSVYLTFQALKPGRHAMTVKASGSEMADAVERSVLVEPDGREVVETANGELDGDCQREFLIPAGAVEGANDLAVKIYPSAFSQVVEGLEGIFQMPSGCFEQTSSTTYPNILVLDYMRRTKRIRPDIEMKALNYVNLGYQRLLSFEVKGGGFEWFGHEPASLVLTAYGLMEFCDMARVHDVDPKVIERTREWLESKQEANGSWQVHSHGVYSALSQDSDAALRTTAYISWALAETGRASSGLGRALDYLVENSGRCNDPYTLALCANALVAAKRPEAADFLARLTQLKQEKDKLVWWNSKGEGATYSRGECLDVETTALAAYACLKAGRERGLAHQALAWLVQKKDPRGTWRSTQATVAAMRALLAGAGANGGALDQTADVTIAVNGQEAKKLRITPETSDVFHLVSLREFVRGGRNTVAVSSSAKGGGLAWQIVATHYLPWKKTVISANEPIAIEQHYDVTRLKTNDLLTCRVTVRYNRKEPANMTIVDLGLPPGFEAQADSFQALQDRGLIERYALTGRQAILYFRQLPVGRPVSFEYRLRAKYPVKVKARGAAVYQYYEPTLRDETLPVELTVL